MDCEKKESPLSIRNLWWKIALAFIAGWLLAFSAMSAAFGFIWCASEISVKNPAVIEKSYEIKPPPPGYVPEMVESIEIVPPPGHVQKESR